MKKATPAGRPEQARPAQGDVAADGKIRLNKLLALNGIASRRRADVLIAEGAVMVDGEIVTELGRRVDPENQNVEVDGVRMRAQGERQRYYLLNKPRGVVCTNDARESRPRAVDLITDRKKGRIYTVGRLDEESVGLVILTNDGDFANRISHPRYGVSKTYRVAVHGSVDPSVLRTLREGVPLSDFTARFAEVRVLKRSERQTLLQIVLNEGRNREIRRALAKLELPVKSLRRVAIGHVKERGLKVGHWRPMTRAEVEDLTRLATETRPPAPKRAARKPFRRSSRRD